MRHINLNKHNPGTAWLEDAKKALTALEKAADAKERSTIFKKYESLWTGQKQALSGLSHGKCWYCESIQARSDNAVDHFRPKARVNGVEKHQGYWWLAFNWKNYRFCCTFCNSFRNGETTSGGKQDFFPLEKEEKRAYLPSDDLRNESPTLLDPTKTQDVLLLSFSEDGSVAPDADEGTVDYSRAEISIKRYHLTEQKLIERRVKVLNDVRGWIERADADDKRFAQNEDLSARDAAEDYRQEILASLHEKAEYSTAVKHLLAGMPESATALKLLKL